MSLNNQLRLAIPTFIETNLIELCYYSFIVSLERCGGICYTFDDLPERICLRYNKRCEFKSI